MAEDRTQDRGFLVGRYVVADGSVDLWVLAGEHRAPSGGAQRARRVGPLETDALGGKSVQRGSIHLGHTVGAHHVFALGICHEDDEINRSAPQCEIGIRTPRTDEPVDPRRRPGGCAESAVLRGLSTWSADIRHSLQVAGLHRLLYAQFPDLLEEYGKQHGGPETQRAASLY